MTRRLGLFIACSLVFWAVTFGLALLLWPDKQSVTLVCSPVAILLCLIPTFITLIFSFWGLNQTPENQLLVVFGGTGLRMFFVLGVGLLLMYSIPAIQNNHVSFWLWVLVYYLTTLAIEMTVVMRGIQVDSPSNKETPAA